MEKVINKDIIVKLQDGDTEALGALLKFYGTPIFSLILRIVQNREDAEEITQDVFIKAFECIKQYRGESDFLTWLYRIAYNKAISHTRKQKREIACDDPRVFDTIDASGSISEKEVLYNALETAINQLPIEESLLITMFYYQNKSIEELSYITDNSVSNVKVKLFRIRKKLHKTIDITSK